MGITAGTLRFAFMDAFPNSFVEKSFPLPYAEIDASDTDVLPTSSSLASINVATVAVTITFKVHVEGSAVRDSGVSRVQRCYSVLVACPHINWFYNCALAFMPRCRGHFRYPLRRHLQRMHFAFLSDHHLKGGFFYIVRTRSSTLSRT